jgi:hypothetical protein
MRRSPRAAAVAAALSLLAGCRPGAPDDNRPVIALVVPADRPDTAFVEVSGLSRPALDALRSQPANSPSWQAFARVEVLPADSDQPGAGLPAVSGAYAVTDAAVRFTPSFPFDPGARYRVAVDTGTLPGGSPGITTAIVGRPAQVVTAARATVTSVSPGGGVLPENVLRVYLHFSAPMGRRGGSGHVRLLDENGREVVDPFLPLEAELWNGDHTRYTLFFDPGRVKTGIRPNDEMGRALSKGRRYTLVVDPDWRDAYGRPLAAPFRHEFRAGPAIAAALDPLLWKVNPPRGGSRDPLVVSFPHALDRGLLARALGVESETGVTTPGTPVVEAHETRWRFVPAAPWQAGRYRLVVLGILEDPSGNRIGRAFEIDPLARRRPGGGGQQETKEVDHTTVPFIIGP